MDTAEVVGTQIITIDPVQYVAAVYAPFRERLAQAKTDADTITSMDVKTKDGMALAVKHRAIFRSIRLEAEEARKLRKAPILTITKLIDGKYAELKTEIAEYEDGFDKPIKAEEERKELERTAAARELERKRIEAEQAAKRAEEERLAAERTEIARQRAELAKAEQARLEAEKQARLKIEQEERAARERIEAQERAARLEREEAERKARAIREAEDRRLREAQAKIDAERHAIEEAKREEAQRERIRAEEQSKAEAKIRAEHEAQQKAAAAQAGVTSDTAIVSPAPAAAPQTNTPQGAARSCESINGTASLATAIAAPAPTPLAAGVGKLITLIGETISDMSAGELQQVLDAAREVKAARRERAMA